MSEYGLDNESPPQQQQQQQFGGEATHNLSTDDPTNAADNSIIGKVKSRVSSILPNRLSKWFSPSTKGRNDELNGSISSSTGAKARRRRRFEFDDDDEFEQEEEEEEHSEADDDDGEGEEDDDDESQNSEEDYARRGGGAAAAPKSTHANLHGRQPPAKRSRLNVDVRDSPLIAPRRPLISSTPAVTSGSYSRNSIAGSGGATVGSQVSRSSYQRFTHLNLYGNQSKKEPAYDFGQQQQQRDSATPKISTDIIDLVSNPPNEADDKIISQSNVYGRSGISSRRSLNIPSSAVGSSSSSRMGAERIMATVGHLQRKSLAIEKTGDIQTSMSVPPRRTSTTIHEVRDSEEQHSKQRNDEEDEDNDVCENNLLKHNGQFNEDQCSELPHKKLRMQRRHINGGSSGPAEIPEESEAILLDTASESGESGVGEMSKMKTKERSNTTGLFNMLGSGGGGGTTRNSSRTSSFGNGLNFYSHLEGRKSLFNAAGGSQGGGHTSSISNQLNTSTLSLTSLNRRQFNASIYGSTSALSDSRLLNTFSPFYKGKTTYGGAAAYNKYTAGAGASAVRITPTLIRPTSSLSSTLSSSSTSLATNTNSLQMGEMSSTAKRILDLISDFATPLSEAKKMAGNMKANASGSQLPPQAKGRLNESDLNLSRAMRLSQVKTPYSRPAVILQPSGNANSLKAAGPLPPVKELQVPTMSQLLQMKKLQNTTERARNIARNSQASNNVDNTEYTLPVATTIGDGFAKASAAGEGEQPPPQQQQQQQQKHTNKMKNKVTATVRTTAASKDLLDEAPPPSVNLPNIAFPLMQSVPKFDITFSKATTTTTTPATTATSLASSSSGKEKQTSNQNAFITQNKTQSNSIALASTSGPLDSGAAAKKENIKPNIFASSSSGLSSTAKTNFKFSEPLVVKDVNTPTHNITPTNLNSYKFSPPLDVTMSMTPRSTTTPTINTVQQQPIKPQQPQLKSGSCLDVLSKPFTVPASSSGSESKPTEVSSSFGSQFKKSSNEWECDTCMIRNKASSTKCVACETPRKGSSTSTASTTSTFSFGSNAAASSANSFGQQFKKSSSEWECDMCMIRNKDTNSKCVACETPRKGGTSTAMPPPPPSIKNTFGDAFKPKSGNWECSTCMISNKSEANECVACQTKKPGSSSSSSSSSTSLSATNTSFKFGFSTAQTNTTLAAPLASADAGFKSLAAQQKASKWECDACMTRNDAERTKCACCDQPKPGTTDNESSTSTSSSTSSSTNKFTFGATAAAKFSFGFGPNANAPKEEELRKDTSKTDEKTTGTTTASKTNTPTPSGFQFGIKPTTTSITPIGFGGQASKKDEVDLAKTSSTQTSVSSSSNVTAVAGFKFGAAPSTTTPSDAAKKSEVSTSTSTTFATSGFSFGLKPTHNATTTTTTSSTTTNTATPAVNSPSVKFNLQPAVATSSAATSTTLPTSSSSSLTSTTATGAAGPTPTFSFGSSSAASSTTQGFSFGSLTKKAAAGDGKESKVSEGFAFKAPATSAVSSTTTTPTTGFVFGSATSAKPPATTSILTSTSSTATAASAAAPVKPMFSFGSTPAAGDTSATQKPTTATSGFGGFSFGSNNTNATTPALGGKTLFGSATGGTSAPAAASSSSSSLTSLNSSTKPAVATTNPTTNVFGSFGGSGANLGGSTASTTPTFGSLPVTANPANNNSTTVSSSASSTTNTNTPTFGSFGSGNAASANSSTTTANVFGSFGGGSKPAAPVFGSGSSGQASTTAAKPFVFGSNPGASAETANSSSSSTNTGITPAAATGASSWPKTSFVFGSSATSTPAAADAGKPSTTTSVFGTFGGSAAASSSSSSSQQQTTSIFGNPTGTTNTSPPNNPPVFGAVAAGTTQSANNSSTNLFAVNSAPAPATTNLFGAANPSGSAATPAPAFGSSPFGGSASATSGTPTFGSTAVTGSATFGGFGAAAAVNTTDIKKPEPAFNFSAQPGQQQQQQQQQQQSSSGGFNFGSNTTKPAFNFGGTTATPTFNFTGSSESQNSTKPFQFGATPSAPVFSFGSSGTGAIETTPSAPFQFNAGTAPVSSNIFAPTPTPGAQSAQQAKRKIRAPIRRVTQR
ncbi:nuclear pore complex protein Nup153 isoform X2 [Musca domestica]|uniref:Nuclear pore complex protein Nup153 n=1 Tax=Musca domestica TaxID=7370 RepID=A0A1I8MU50_MUSDO|nr:nuclear pore complex protein Nup153 isoform X2 [Musca domestica]